MWARQQDSNRFSHLGEAVWFLLDNARETKQPFASLFPSLLRTELHDIRAWIEEKSNILPMLELAQGTACGVMLQKSTSEWNVPLRVKTSSGTFCYTLDRWD